MTVRREQAQHLGQGPTMLAEHLQHIGQERDARAEQHEAEDAERMALVLAIVRQWR